MSRITHLKHFSTFIFLVLGVFTTLYVAFPDLSDGFLDENRLVEVLTVFIYVYAFVQSIMITKIAQRSYVRFVSLFLASISFLFILEETSFGRDLVYRYDRPDLYGVPIDSLHDFITVFHNMLIHSFFSVATISFVIAFSLLLLVIIFLCKKHSSISCKFFQSTSAWFIGISLTCLITASLLDIGPADANKTMTYVEEMLELSAACAMAFSVRALFQDHFIISEKP